MAHYSNSEMGCRREPNVPRLLQVDDALRMVPMSQPRFMQMEVYILPSAKTNSPAGLMLRGCNLCLRNQCWRTRVLGERLLQRGLVEDQNALWPVEEALDLLPKVAPPLTVSGARSAREHRHSWEPAIANKKQRVGLRSYLGVFVLSAQQRYIRSALPGYVAGGSRYIYLLPHLQHASWAPNAFVD
jgi:hypothetical protein